MTSDTENKKKLESFFRQEYQALRAYVSSRLRVGRELDAEDIVQDVALRLFSGADRYEPINNVAGFVYRTVRNKLIDVMRKGRPLTKDEDESDAALNEFTELLYGPSANAYSEEMKEELKQTIMNLKEPYRDIIIAVDFEGYAYSEISEETGIPEGTLMSRRHRAMAILHKELKNKVELTNITEHDELL